MPRTRVRTATKPATRSAPKATIAQRPSTASSLDFLSQDSQREHTPTPGRKRRGKASPGKHKPTDHLEASSMFFCNSKYAERHQSNPPLVREHDHSGDNDSRIGEETVRVKDEPKDSDTEPEKKQPKGKKRTQESETMPSAPKKRKPSPPTTRTRARNPLPSKAKKQAMIMLRSSGSSSDSESELSKLKAELAKPWASDCIAIHTMISHTAMLPYLDLLRPYMTFQLSLSGLSGAAYEAAEASMTSVIDVIDRFQSSPTLLQAGYVSIDEEGKTAVNRRDGNGVVLVNKKKEEESIVARKLRELEDDVGVDSETHDDSSNSGTGSDAEVTGDEDEVDALERRVDSITSASTGYESDSPSTDSAESESSGEDTDAIERREKNAVRRQKARQKRRNETMRGVDASDAENERKCGIKNGKEDRKDVEISIENKKEMERVKRMQQTSTRPLVAFSPVAW